MSASDAAKLQHVRAKHFPKKPGDKYIEYKKVAPDFKGCEVISNRIYAEHLRRFAGSNGFHTGVLRGGTVFDNMYPSGISIEDWRNGAYTVPATCYGPNISFDAAQSLGIGMVTIYDR